MGFIADAIKMIIWVSVVAFTCLMFVDALDETAKIEQMKAQQSIERITQ